MNVIFVVQRGELELKAVLLAWSLRRSHGKVLRLFAACPQFADWCELADETRSLLQRLEVTLCSFEPSFAPDYPIGNKLDALGLLPAGEPGLFLDSDMLSLRRWIPAELLGGFTCAVKPADVATWGDDDRWQRVYALAGLEVPTRKVRLTVTGQLTAPYFNAGLVATRDPGGLAMEWQRLARLLQASSEDLGERYPWLDQIALPLALARRQEDWRPLPECWNYPAHLKALGHAEVNVCHYHSPGVILREPRLRGLFLAACRRLPGLAALARAQGGGWATLLNGQGAPLLRHSKKRDFLITGIPRSGTSYLCHLLHRQRNWVVINEPAEIFELLDRRPDASGLPLLHRHLREQIYCAKPIENKVEDGNVISDTADRDVRELYRPALDSPDFWLGSKNTLVYMAALAPIRELGWPVLAMVRHPLDTLASWRNTFDHLREAQVNQLPVANPKFHGWTNAQRLALEEVALQTDATLRRVLFWRLLARTLLDHADWLTLWRYEDLTRDPAGHLSRFNRQLGYRARLPKLEGHIRTRTAHWDLTERAMLSDLCANELKELQYAI